MKYPTGSLGSPPPLSKGGHNKFTPNHKNNEDVEYTLFDELIEEFFNDEYDEATEYEYDMKILNEQQIVLSFEDFLFETE